MFSPAERGDGLAQAHDEGLTTPIVMLTSEAQPSVIQLARECSKGWRIRPFKADLLVAAVNKLVSR